MPRYKRKRSRKSEKEKAKRAKKPSKSSKRSDQAFDVEQSEPPELDLRTDSEDEEESEPPELDDESYSSDGDFSEETKEDLFSATVLTRSTFNEDTTRNAAATKARGRQLSSRFLTTSNHPKSLSPFDYL